MKHVGIVGAGIAGLTAAHHLAKQGLRVRVFEKSRGPGGRMATRREGRLEFDHGAQSFTARGEELREALRDWCARGVAAVWPGRCVTLEEGVARPARETSPRYVGTPRMNAPCHDLARGIEVSLSTRVGRLQRETDAWRLLSDAGRDLGRFDVAIITTPAAQAIPLLTTSPDLASSARAAIMAPCWAVMLGFDEPLSLSWDAAFVHASPLSWVARNASKPGRPAGETWVLHATPSWSAENASLEAADVEATLRSSFFRAAGLHPVGSAFARAHAWRYAKCEKPLRVPFLFDAATGLGACGDWCLGDRVEDAFSSGLALAQRILAS